MRKIIGVIGGNSVSDKIEKIAEQTGFLIINAGYSLVCGGMAGVMQAACKGGQKAKANLLSSENKLKYLDLPVTIGILPSADKTTANKYIDIIIPTGIGYARNTIVVNTAVAIIAIDGSSGTLSELAFAWQAGIPIIAIKNSGGWANKVAGTKLDSKREDIIHSASDPENAIELLNQILN